MGESRRSEDDLETFCLEETTGLAATRAVREPDNSRYLMESDIFEDPEIFGNPSRS